MKSLLAAAVVSAAGCVLAGCGSATTSPRVGSVAAGDPSWGDCGDFSTMNLDYTVDARGATTRGAAIARYREAGDHVVFSPAHDHWARSWLLVDDANVIHTSVETFHTRHGWLVNTVEKCAD